MMLLSTKLLRLKRWPRVHSLSMRSFCEDASGDKGEEKDKKADTGKQKEKEGKQKMLELLKSIKTAPKPRTEKVQISRPEPQQKQINERVIEKPMKKALKDVAQKFGPQAKETEADLLTALLSVSGSKQTTSDLLSGMKVTKSKPQVKPQREFERGPPPGQDRGPESKLHEFKGRFPRQRDSREADSITRIHGYPPLDIFPSNFKPSPDAKESFLRTWDVAEQRERAMAVTQNPRNSIEEMIRWTEEGKLWQFPIDNEIGLEEEKSYSFADHIFLEKHLEGWCPTRGPIRHFMELVCVGLSKNPYVSVPRKVANIHWFRDYFDSNKEVLKETGAL